MSAGNDPEWPDRSRGTQAGLAGFADDQVALDDLEDDADGEEEDAEKDVLPEDEQGACPHVRAEDCQCFDCYMDEHASERLAAIRRGP